MGFFWKLLEVSAGFFFVNIVIHLSRFLSEIASRIQEILKVSINRHILKTHNYYKVLVFLAKKFVKNVNISEIEEVVNFDGTCIF